MKEEYSLLSPEKVYFSFDLAGLASRAIALIIDSIIQYLLILFIIAVGVFFASLYGMEELANTVIESWFFLVILLLTYVGIFYGYFLFFEIIWSGQTPGKKVAKIRVVKDNGATVTVASVLIRNTLRIIDSLPTSYVIGLITLLINKKNQRLGDMAAGTIVIREKGYELPQTLEVEVKEYPWSGSLKLKIHQINEEEFAMLKSFLLRYPLIDKPAAEVTLKKLRDYFINKFEIPEGEIQESKQFLEQIAALYQQK